MKIAYFTVIAFALPLTTRPAQVPNAGNGSNGRAMSSLNNFDSRSLVHGDPLPADNGRVRIYQMRFCPFGERALLTASVKRIPADIVNVDFHAKPDWFVQRSPFGSTPAADYKGASVFDSAIVAEWLDRLFADNQPRLIPDDATAAAQQRMLVERLAKLKRWFVVAHGTADRVPAAVVEMKEGMRLADQLLVGDYFGGNEIGWADVMLWPFIERIPAVDVLYPQSDMAGALAALPRLGAYMNRMLARPEVKSVSRAPEYTAGFFRTEHAGWADYNYGLD